MESTCSLHSHATHPRRWAANHHTGKYHLPGGGINIGERMEETLKRETREETGIGLVVLSIVALVRNQGIDLVEQGIYGIVHHPMYLGAMICFLSYFFFHPHWLILLISSANIAIIYWFILQGEQQNITKFDDAYKRYMETVPRINLPLSRFNSRTTRNGFVGPRPNRCTQ